MSDRCEPEVFENGILVFLTHTITAKEIEIWVQKIAVDSGEKVDWHYAGGRVNVLALGDIDKVKKFIVKNKKLHDIFFQTAFKEILPNHNNLLQPSLNEIWKYNGY